VLLLLQNQFILYLACQYLGQLPILTELSFYYSPSRSLNEHNYGSQNWHLDNDKSYRLKLFYSPYIVDETSGPTTFIPCCFTKGLAYPNYPGYFTDHEAKLAGFPIEKSCQLTTRPDEFFLVDTSTCFHFGSRTSSGSRFLLIAGLSPHTSFLNPFKIRKLHSTAYGFPFYNRHLRYSAIL